MFRTFAVVAWFFGAAVAGCGRTPSADVAPLSTDVARPSSTSGVDLKTQLDELAAAHLAESSAAGMSVAVVKNGQQLLTKGYGLADVDGKVDAAPDTIYHIGSLTKSFTGAAILKLAAAGKLSLDDEITKFLPEYPTLGKKITIRQLLTHTSGIKDVTELPAFRDRMSQSFPRQELVDIFAAEPLEFEPGAKWSYSNSGYILLGLIIEQVSGQTVEAYLNDQVIRPLGLASTEYCARKADGSARRALGYQIRDGSLVPAEPMDMDHAFAAGGLCSTAGDVVKWLQALAGHTAVTETQWELLTTPVTLVDGTTEGYGLGLGLDTHDGHSVVGHSGGISGFASWMSYYPADDLYVSVLVNSDSELADTVGMNIGEVVLDAAEE